MLATSWSAGFVLPRSPFSCQCTSSFGVEYSSSAISRVATSIKRWKYPWCERRMNKSSLRSPRLISLSLQIQTRWCTRTCSNSLLSLSCFRRLLKRLTFLRRSLRTKISQKKRKQLIFPPRITVNQTTSSIVATSITTTIKATNVITTINDLTIVIETINAKIVLVATIRTLKAASSKKKRWLQAWSLQEKEQWGHAQWPVLFGERMQLIQKKELLLLKISFALLFPVSLLLEQQELWQSPCGSGWPLAKRAPKSGYLYSSESDDSGCTHHPDKSDTIFSTFSTPMVKRGKCPQIENHASREFMCPTLRLHSR